MYQCQALITPRPLADPRTVYNNNCWQLIPNNDIITYYSSLSRVRAACTANQKIARLHDGQARTTVRRNLRHYAGKHKLRHDFFVEGIENFPAAATTQEIHRSRVPRLKIRLSSSGKKRDDLTIVGRCFEESPNAIRSLNRQKEDRYSVNSSSVIVGEVVDRVVSHYLHAVMLGLGSICTAGRPSSFVDLVEIA